MTWRKLGRIFHNQGGAPWMVSHAANPVAEALSSTEVRVYFSVRDDHNRSHITCLDFNIATLQVVRPPERCLLYPGETGAFDDSGVSAGWLLRDQGELLLFYLGWNLGVTVPWRNSIGLARMSGRSGVFERVSIAPVLDRSDADPFSISYPCVMREGDQYRMWYGSNLAWGAAQESMAHVIKYTEGTSPRHWHPKGTIVIPLVGDDFAISKPCVVRDADGYRMWFSHRGERYRIGYAESHDGVVWDRCDRDAGITVSDEGWDSEMICYPFVFDLSNARYMLYNGNRYGRDGFGLAVLE